MKEKIRNLKDLTVNQIFKSNYKTMLSYCLKQNCKKKSKNLRVATTQKKIKAFIKMCSV